MHTQRAEVHEAGEGDDPEVHAVDCIATVELEDEPTLDRWVSGHSNKRRAYQEAVSQPTVQEEH